MTGEENLGVTLSRTMIPALPPHYLSRKHLFPLIDNQPPGSTLVIAPAGYGKSALISEWCQSRAASTIWLTVSNEDSLNEMSAAFIAATRNILPGFAPWFERDQPLRPTEVVRRWGNDLLQTGKNFIFVLDNIRSSDVEDVDIANRLIEQFPSNIHFIAIRKDELESVFSTLNSRGPLKVITVNDLRFTDSEIEHFAANTGVILNPASMKALQSAHGWPSATSLLLSHIQMRGELLGIEELIGADAEPLRALALLVIRKLDPEILEMCERLSLLDSFSKEIAQIIMGDKFSSERLNDVAFRGEIFTLSREPHAGYIFSPMMREIFLAEFSKRPEEKVALHKVLIDYFIRNAQPGLALDHAFQAGDGEKIKALFQDAARIKQAVGQGGDLLRWANFISDGSTEGELRRSTVEITGYLSNLDFGTAKSQLSRLLLASDTSPARPFYRQFVSGALTYIHITLGKFEEVEEDFKSSHSCQEDCLLGIDDQINLLRLLSAKRYIWNEGERVEELLPLATELAKKTTLNTSHTFLLAIEAMTLHQRGEYRRAYELATTAISQFKKHGYVGNHGPLDVMYIQARCLLEFSRRSEAIAILEQLKNLSQQWKQWHWYLAAENHILQEQMMNGQKNEVLERIKTERKFVQTIDAQHNLEAFIDINEMFPRLLMKDYGRLATLVARTPQTRDVLQYKMNVDESKGIKSVSVEVENLPERTPREKIWKYMKEAMVNLDSESVAVSHMNRALKVGAEVGARESFLRQSNEIGNLIIRAANDSPTIYNEELATAMALRIKERGMAMTQGHPALTKRELEILRHLSTGRTLTVIAGELHISQNTMKTHLKNLYKKLAVEGRNEAVEKANSLFLL